MAEADRESHQVPIVQDGWERVGSVIVGVFRGGGVNAVGRAPAWENNEDSWLGDIVSPED